MNYDIISLSLYSDKYSESEVCTNDTCLIDHSGDIIHIKFWSAFVGSTLTAVILLPAHPASFAHNFVSAGMQRFYFSESHDAKALQTCH